MGFPFVLKRTYERERRERLNWQECAARHAKNELFYKAELKSLAAAVRREADKAVGSESVLED